MFLFVIELYSYYSNRYSDSSECSSLSLNFIVIIVIVIVIIFGVNGPSCSNHCIFINQKVLDPCNYD